MIAVKLGVCLLVGLGFGAVVYLWPSPWWYGVDGACLVFAAWRLANHWLWWRREKRAIATIGGTGEAEESIKAQMRTLIANPQPLTPDQMLWLQERLEAQYPTNHHLSESYIESLNLYWIMLLRRCWQEVIQEEPEAAQERLEAMMNAIWNPLSLVAGEDPSRQRSIGDVSCHFNARSSQLRCALHPTAATCDNCRDYKPQ